MAQGDLLRLTSRVAKLSVYEKIHLFSNCLIEESEENLIVSKWRQLELNIFLNE